jgi:hypothetical protein
MTRRGGAERTERGDGELAPRGKDEKRRRGSGAVGNTQSITTLNEKCED